MVKIVEAAEPNGIHLLVNNAGIARDDNTKYSNGKPDFTVIAYPQDDAISNMPVVRPIHFRSPDEVRSTSMG